MGLTVVRCALCAEPFASPGDYHMLAVVVQPPSGKARSIYRSHPICETCATPDTHTGLLRLVSRLPGIFRIGS